MFYSYILLIVIQMNMKTTPVTDICSKLEDPRVKGNQETLFDDIQASFSMMPAQEKAESLDFGHGRIETRRCSIITDLGLMEDAQKWGSLSTLVRLECERCFKSTGEGQTSTRFYISSLVADARPSC